MKPRVLPQGSSVRFWLAADAEPLNGVVVAVGMGNGTYRIRSARRIYTVSFGMAKPAELRTESEE